MVTRGHHASSSRHPHHSRTKSSRRRVLRRILGFGLALPFLGALVAMVRRVQATDVPADVTVPPDVPVGLSVVEAVIIHAGIERHRARVLGTVHAPGLPDRPGHRRRGGVPLPRFPVPRGRHGRVRSRRAAAHSRFGSNRTRQPEAGLPVPPERPGQGPVLTLPWGTIGDLATAAFVVAAVSGVAVAVPYDTQDALRVDRGHAPRQSRGSVLPQRALLGRPAVPGADAGPCVGPPASEHRASREPGRVAAPRADAAAAGLHHALGVHAARRCRRPVRRCAS